MSIRLTTVVAALALSACSSGYSSGVDGSKPFSTLTAAEAMTACENLNDYFQSTFSRDVRNRFNCYAQALSSTTSPEACQASYEACLVSPPSTPLNLDPIDCSMATMGDPTCNARVSEVEACITAQGEAQKSRIDEVDCSIAGNLSELERIQQPIPLPSECTRLRETCPSFAGDDG